MKLVIGNKNYSSWSLRPWLLLSEHKIPFEEIRVALSQANTKTLLAQYSDTGLVPVLHDNGLVICDSLAICEYVSERYLHGRGWPENYKLRAQARSYCAQMHSGFTTIRSLLPMNCRAKRRVPMTDSLAQEIKRVDALWAQARHNYANLGPWLFGQFSIADCMFAPVVLRFHTYGIDLSATSSAYVQTMLGNAALGRWLEDAKQETEIIDEDEAGTEVDAP